MVQDKHISGSCVFFSLSCIIWDVSHCNLFQCQSLLSGKEEKAKPTGHSET